MKKSATLLLIVILTLLLQSCSSGSDTNKDATSAAQIYTSVAASLTAQAASQPTSTITPQSTATLTPTKESLTIPTLPQIASTTTFNSGVCDDSAFVGDVTIADGTTVSPGESFTKTWRIQNTGSCTWDTTYKIVFSSGEAMSGVTTSVPYAVSSGKQMDISVSMISPTTLGTYVGHWYMQNPAGTAFGKEFFVQIVVATSTSTPTPTSTSTSAATSTSTPTTENTATSTPEPAATATTASS